MTSTTEASAATGRDRSMGEKRCIVRLAEPTDAFEWSFVAVPAQPRAGVVKGFQPGTTLRQAPGGPGLWPVPGECMDPEAVLSPDRHRGGFGQDAFLRGITRLPASRAAGGTLRFSVQTAGTADLPIPQGTVCPDSGPGGLCHHPGGGAGRGQTQVDLLAQAVEPPPGGTCLRGRCRPCRWRRWALPPAPTRSPSPAAGKRRGDEALRERVLATYRQLPNGANKAYYAQQALGAEG